MIRGPLYLLDRVQSPGLQGGLGGRLLSGLESLCG